MALILLAVPLPCLLGLAWLWYRVLRKPKHQHAVCGQCQYIVEGLQTMFCPECGGDFRKVGIETPGKRDQIGPVRFLVLWTVLLAPLALMVSVVAIALGPQRVTGASTCGLSPTSHSFRRVNLCFRSDFTAPNGFTRRRRSGPGLSSSGRRVTLRFPTTTPSRAADVVELTISGPSKPMPPPSARMLSVYPRSGAYRYTNAAGQTVDQAQGFNQAVMADWFAAFGLTADAPDAADAAELFALVNAYAQGQASFTANRYVSAGGSSSMSNSRPAGWMLGGVSAFWLLVYVSGIVLYYRRRRRMAPAIEAIPAPA